MLLPRRKRSSHSATASTEARDVEYAHVYMLAGLSVERHRRGGPLRRGSSWGWLHYKHPDALLDGEGTSASSQKKVPPSSLVLSVIQRFSVHLTTDWKQRAMCAVPVLFVTIYVSVAADERSPSMPLAAPCMVLIISLFSCSSIRVRGQFSCDTFFDANYIFIISLLQRLHSSS